jgi:hypothetical protein
MDVESALEDFLRQKGINAPPFALGMPERYAHMKTVWQASGTMGLDYAYKFLWNELRREFPAGENSLKKE